MAHTLNLVIQGALQGIKGTCMPHIIEWARKMALHFCHSVWDSELLQQKQEKLGLPLHHLIQDVATPWNFTFYPLERVLEQQTELHYLALETSICVDAPLG